MESTVFAGKTLLITGGTGSFGNTVLKHFLSTDIGEISIFSRDEKKQDDMRHDYQLKYPELSGKIKFYIGDVRNPDSLRGVMRGVDYIFHAAALKQVPSCEFFPMEAVRTNVLGTDNVLTAAIDAGVKKVVCLSTDKAAYPINAMGISKAMMEKVIGAKARTVKAEATTICCTRYGNVMASRGSVIPLFIDGGDDLMGLALHLGVHLAALGLLEALADDVLSRLRGDAPEVLCLERDGVFIAHLAAFLFLLGLLHLLP